MVVRVCADEATAAATQNTATTQASLSNSSFLMTAPYPASRRRRESKTIGYVNEAGSKAGLVISVLPREKHHRCHCPALSDFRFASTEGLSDKLKMVPQPKPSQLELLPPNIVAP